MKENRPTSLDLLEAVAEFIENIIIPKLDSYSAFHARVSVNALGIVRREIEFGGALNKEEHKRLSLLLNHEGGLNELNALLCQRIRDAQINQADAGLIDHMKKTTMGKLSIDNPEYSTYKQWREREAKA